MKGVRKKPTAVAQTVARTLQPALPRRERGLDWLTAEASVGCASAVTGRCVSSIDLWTVIDERDRAQARPFWRLHPRRRK
jgi:hypothetical protein